MNLQLPNTRPVSSSEQVSFHCKHCGACCRHVRESVPLNTLDAYRLPPLPVCGGTGTRWRL